MQQRKVGAVSYTHLDVYKKQLYSSATGHSHAESWAPLGEIFADHPNIHVYIDEIVSIHAGDKIISGSSGADYSYETLLIAVGVVTSFFGIHGLETYTYGINNAHEIHRLKPVSYTHLDLYKRQAVGYARQRIQV